MSENINLQNETNVVSQYPDYKWEIVAILRGKLTPKHMQDQLLAYHENDIAAALELMEPVHRGKLYRLLDADTLASVLEYSEEAEKYIAELNMRKKVDVISRLELATAVDVLQRMEKSERGTLIELFDRDFQDKISRFNSFCEDEIGSAMSTNYISIDAGCTVRSAMRELVDQAAENDNISTIYVVDEDKTLVGAIDLKDLIVARENTPIESITMKSYPYVYAEELIEDCIEHLRGYSEDSIPVLDSRNRLEGVLTSQILTELVGDVLSEDYARLAGLSAEEDLQEPLKKSIGKRLPWLMVLFGLGLLVSAVVGLFENVVAELSVIVSFQSLVLGMAGNGGTQSLAVTIRVLMDEQVERKEKLYLIGKEARVGMLNGLILGALSFLMIGLYLAFLKGEPASFAFSVSLCTGGALFISMVLAGISGTVVPILFKKHGVDPAVASGPMITTVNDLVAVVSYYGLAWLFLIRLMHF